MQNEGNINPVDLSILIDDSPAAAAGVLTHDATNPSNNDTVTIGSTVYTFKTTLTGAANEILIGADADATLQALADAINDGIAAVAASGILTSDETKPTAADTVTVGGKVYTFVAALTEAIATATLTHDGSNPTAGDTVTVGNNVYEFVSSLTIDRGHGQSDPVELPNKVLIGADADTTLNNLVAAINGDTGEGTKYSFNTVQNPLVSAAAESSNASIMSARAGVGTAGNSIAKAETSSHLDWDGAGATFTGGLASVANEISLVGADADYVMNSLILAINGGAGAGTRYSSATVASTEMTAGALAAHAFTVTAILPGSAGNSLAKAENSTHLDWDGAGAVMTGGIAATAAHTLVTSSDVAAQAITVTAITAGYAGNAIAKAESCAHLDWDGAGAVLTGGGATIGTSDEIGVSGKLSVIISEAPQFTGSPTYTVTILDTNGKVNYVSGNLNENAVTRTVVEQQVQASDKIKITTSAIVEDTLPVLVRLR